MSFQTFMSHIEFMKLCQNHWSLLYMFSENNLSIYVCFLQEIEAWMKEHGLSLGKFQTIEFFHPKKNIIYLK